MSKNFKKNLLFSSPFFEFENVNLASKLHQHINTLNIDGIESNVANQVKHNLSESKFDFFNSEVDVIKETRTFLASCLKDILNNLYTLMMTTKLLLLIAGIILVPKIAHMICMPT